jgi:ketosteroid isomerase-like protein
MIRTLITITGCLVLMMACNKASQNYALEDLRLQVEESERAFAKTMADRDFDAFVSFLSDEAVFFSGANALTGKQQVAVAWKGLYEAPDAPFSWEPEQVTVLESGTLALSTGPVLNPEGKPIATFTSIWRLEPSGEWRIIFDKGCEVCNCSEP